jgi:hypothetical protein
VKYKKEFDREHHFLSLYCWRLLKNKDYRMVHDEDLQCMLMAFDGMVNGFTLKEIQQRYGGSLSLPTITRRQTKAMENGWIRNNVCLNIPEKYSETFLNCLTYGKVEKRLLEAINNANNPVKTSRENGSTTENTEPVLRQVTVSPPWHITPRTEPVDLSYYNRSKSADNPQKESARFRSHFGVAFHVAGWLSHNILRLWEKRKKIDSKPPVNIGLNYGYLVHKACGIILNHWANEDIFKDVKVRISGIDGIRIVDPKDNDRLARTSWAVSCIVNCDLLSNLFAYENTIIDRINVPAQLKQSYNAIQLKTLRSHILSDPGYSYLYGEKPLFPTTNEVNKYRVSRSEKRKTDSNSPFGNYLDHDIVITGLSALNPHSGFHAFSSFGIQEEIEKIQHTFPDAGEVAGHIFLNSGNIPRRDSSKHEAIGLLNSRRIGLWPEDLMDLARIRKDNANGGVFMCCSDPEKASALYTVLTKMDIVNHLFIDVDTAHALYKKLGLTEEDFAADVSARDKVLSRL